MSRASWPVAIAAFILIGIPFAPMQVLPFTMVSASWRQAMTRETFPSSFKYERRLSLDAVTADDLLLLRTSASAQSLVSTGSPTTTQSGREVQVALTGQRCNATRRDGTSVRVFDRTKKYAPGRQVDYDAIRAFIMVCNVGRATKGF